MPRPPSARRRFTVRTNRRFHVACPLYYLGRGLLGKGVAVDLSMKGWRVKGDAPVRPGQWLAFRLQLGQSESPIKIHRAIVRWADTQEFGVEWLVADRETELGLRGFVHEMAARL